jgi:hypothetical protein
MRKNALSSRLAFFMLAVMFAISLSSAWNESAVMDELAHIPAGYSYVTQKDMRLNPEHPPLLKDLAGLSDFLFVHPVFSTNIKSWTDDINDPWVEGLNFLYESGNNADEIIRVARLPFMILAVLLGWLLFAWSRSVYGNRVALLVVFLYSFSPTFLAHSRYVTTDSGAAFGFLIGIATFVRFLEKPNAQRIVVAGIALGVAELLKYSLFLLIPIYGVLTLLWPLIHEGTKTSSRSFGEAGLSYLKELWSLLRKTAVIGLLGLAVIWVVYSWHVWNYPPERQYRDAESILRSFGRRWLVALDLWFIRQPLGRPIGQYLLGLLMVIQRVAGGNTTYYLGEVSTSGWRSYFPVAYLLKETLAFHLLTLLAIGLAIRNVMHAQEKSWRSICLWSRDNFALVASFVVLAVYWSGSIRGGLNIGVRHILPTFPFVFLLVSRQIVMWSRRRGDLKTVAEAIRALYRSVLEPAPRVILPALLVLWILVSAATTYPFYLSYYNEIVGINNGYKYIVDSNYDWGQDLKRLGDEMRAKNIPRIHLEYFGGGSPAYYLGDRFEPWRSAKGPPPSGSYFAISATLLEGAEGRLAPGLARKPEDSYLWLHGIEPIARGGSSIFIYHIP